jgi:hypothetical protein
MLNLNWRKSHDNRYLSRSSIHHRDGVRVHAAPTLAQVMLFVTLLILWVILATELNQSTIDRKPKP